jgi:IS605 OrfB family transposase
MFHRIYKDFELSEDLGFQHKTQEEFGLDSWFYQSCKTEVKMKIEQRETNISDKQKRIDEITKRLDTEAFEGKKGARWKFKLTRKAEKLTRNLHKEITFGTRALLQKISYISNLKNSTKEEDKEEYEKLDGLKEEYHKNRILPMIIIGEAPQKSNRKFDFDLVNKKLIFKPKKGIHIPIEFHCSKGQYRELVKLQQQIGEQAITVCLDNEHVRLTFDEQKLNGFAFDEIEYFRELKTIDKADKPARKECYIKWINEQKDRMFVGKMRNRFIGVDLNPEFIGVSVLERLGNSFKIIFKEVISFENLNTKMGLSSEDPEQIYQNNKRIHEVCEAWKSVFKIAEHYKCAYFVMEDLEFKKKDEFNAKEANRKTKNLWHRTLTEELINRFCNEKGLELRKVNSAYSSFIGNIKYGFFDPASAAIEITRRGIYKYDKGSSVYPLLEKTDLDTMCSMGLDVLKSNVSTWVKAFKSFKTAGLRYRRELKDFVESNLMSHKSGIEIYSFI